MIYLLHVRDNLSVETVKERLTIEGGGTANVYCRKNKK